MQNLRFSTHPEVLGGLIFDPAGPLGIKEVLANRVFWTCREESGGKVIFEITKNENGSLLERLLPQFNVERVVMDFFDFAEEFRPITLNTTAPLDGTVNGFGHHRPHVEWFKEHGLTLDNRIFTVIEGDGFDEPEGEDDEPWLIIPGNHIVNVIDRLVTLKPCPWHNIEVTY